MGRWASVRRFLTSLEPTRPDAPTTQTLQEILVEDGGCFRTGPKMMGRGDPRRRWRLLQDRTQNDGESVQKESSISELLFNKHGGDVLPSATRFVVHRHHRRIERECVCVAGVVSAMAIAGSLSKEQLESFHSQGFLAIESFATGEEVQDMIQRMEELLDDFDCAAIKSIFSTISHKHGSDDYFLDSAEKISFFFEEKAFQDDGELKQPKQLSINKVGHALHEIDQVFKRFSYSEKISNLLLSLHYRSPVIIQSMYIFKQPGIGGEVVPHQDNSFLYTEPRSCTGLWLALEDATIANGCLWAIPGSHKNGLMRRFVRDDNGVHFNHPSPSYNRHDFVPIEVKAGSLVVIHGDLVHQSFQNMSSKSRHAFSLHAVETDRCTWTSDNWIRRKKPPEPLYVS